MSAPHDELHDEPEDLSQPGPLGEFLRLCQKQLLPLYREADREALGHQRRHRLFTRLAGGFGALGLFLTAVNIAFPGEPAHTTFWPPRSRFDWLLAFEAAAALLAVACVVVGLTRDWHQKWLVSRYVAERLRLLKFQFLVDPEFWCRGPSSPSSQGRFVSRIQKIAALEEDHLGTLAEEEEVPSLPADAACESLDDGLRGKILEYYRRKRLDFQIGYFSRIARRDARRWYQNPRWLPLVFFSSVAFVVLHAYLEYVEPLRRHEPRLVHPGVEASLPAASEPADPIERGKRAALALSLGIPAVWTAFRTYRTANEFGRNKSRSLAKHSALTQIAARLSPESPPAEAFSDMSLCEYILASDQGEWLRLMREAEWYG